MCSSRNVAAVRLHRYGQVVQLRHVSTGRFVTVKKTSAHVERGALQVVLQQDGEPGSWLTVLSGYRTKAEGSHVRVNEIVSFVSTAFAAMGLRTSAAAVRDQAMLPLNVHPNVTSTVEVCAASQESSTFRAVLFRRSPLSGSSSKTSTGQEAAAASSSSAAAAGGGGGAATTEDAAHAGGSSAGAASTATRQLMHGYDNVCIVDITAGSALNHILAADDDTTGAFFESPLARQAAASAALGGGAKTTTASSGSASGVGDAWGAAGSLAKGGDLWRLEPVELAECGGPLHAGASVRMRHVVTVSELASDGASKRGANCYS